MARPSISAIANTDGTVTISVNDHAATFRAEEIGAIAVMLLDAAQNATFKSGIKPSELEDDHPLKDIPGFAPAGFSILEKSGTLPAAIVIYAGLARFGIGLDKRKMAHLAEMLKTLSAEGQAN